MPFKVNCPQGHVLAVSDRYAGRRVRCPKCQAAVVVPAIVASKTESATNGELIESKKPTSVAPAKEAGKRLPPPLPKPAQRPDPTPPPARPPVATMVPSAPPVATATSVGKQMTRHTPPTDSPRIAAAQGPNFQGYRAEQARVKRVYWIALGLLAVVAFQVAPIVGHLNPASAPSWARWVLLLAVLEIAYAAWMVSLPDWSTVRVAMIVLATVATIYGIGLGIAVITPRGSAVMLEMDDIRDKARLWCSAVMLVTGLMTYACGRVGFQWRKAYWVGR